MVGVVVIYEELIVSYADNIVHVDVDADVVTNTVDIMECWSLSSSPVFATLQSPNSFEMVLKRLWPID